VNIGNVEIGNGNPCRFIAEVSCNHNGKLALAHTLIDRAKESQADFVKFQCYLPSELVELRGDGPAPEPWGSEGWTMKSLYEKAATPHSWFPELFQHARDIGIVPFSSVFGLESLVVLEKCACPAYKIARLDNKKYDLIQAATSRRKPVIVSSSEYPERGMMYRADMTLYCPPNYPTERKDVRLPVFNYTTEFSGLSSHCLDGDLPVAAVARGCQIIEMHFQDSDEPSELERNVSLYPVEFADMVQRVREVEEMLA
jgi:sialic acid synthase SpsE